MTEARASTRFVKLPMACKQIPALDIYPNFQQRLGNKSGLARLAMTALPFIPRHAYHPFISELNLAFRRITNRPKRVREFYKGRRDLLVNIGCGERGKPGWENVDFVSSPSVNCVYDCRRGLPFDTDAVKGIFTEHFFEHIDYTEEVPFFLSECNRVLQPGGVIRIIVPDAEKYVRAYCTEGWDDLAHVRPLNPDHSDVHFGSKFNTKMEVLNAMFRQYSEHKFAYDFPTLEFLLCRYGFSEVQNSAFGRSTLPELAIDSRDRASESLYVEARKPALRNHSTATLEEVVSPQVVC
jgi:predicted SAM-dependent methyltransferase